MASSPPSRLTPLQRELPQLDDQKPRRGQIRIDSLREICANKICTLLGRAQIKDLVDMKVLLDSGENLEEALQGASRKDAGSDPAALAWVLEQLTISNEARLPGGVDPVALAAFRKELVVRLQELAFRRARR